MNQTISTRTVLMIGITLVILVGGIAAWVWTRPSATAQAGADAKAGSKGVTGGAANSREGGMREHGGPTPDQLKEIQEWKRNNPGATTRY